MLLVTHDEDLLEEVGTRVWQFDRGCIRDFKDSYEGFAAATAKAGLTRQTTKTVFTAKFAKNAKFGMALA